MEAKCGHCTECTCSVEQVRNEGHSGAGTQLGPMRRDWLQEWAKLRQRGPICTSLRVWLLRKVCPASLSLSVSVASVLC